MAQRSTHLVLEHLENVHADIFEQNALSITQLVGKRNGIYALYRTGALYYVGLAKDLRSRLKAHLRDRHRGAWDRFSVYLTNDDKHLRELESLLLRVVRPEGNRVRGKFSGSLDRKRDLDRMIKADQVQLRNGLLGKPLPKTRAVMLRPNGGNGTPEGTRHLRAFYKDKVYTAILRKDGTVSHRNRIYTSLSAAGKAITKRATNGRYFWSCKNADGDWERLSAKT